MSHYAGLDVSLEETAICIMDEVGQIVKEVRAPSVPEALIIALENPATMSRGIEQRLRKLEAANDGPQRPRIVFSVTSDEADWDSSQIAEMIGSGQASADDEFMRIGGMAESRLRMPTP